MKRSRHQKLENKEEYDIVRRNSVPESLLFTYVAPVTSGLEADEEKEYHLKNVIENKNNIILIPKIRNNCEPLKRFEDFKLPDTLIKVNKDIKINFFNQKDIQKISEGLNVSEETLKKNFASKNFSTKEFYTSIEDVELKNYIKSKILLVNNDDEMLPENCFRTRQLYTPRKNKKYDSIVLEKLKKLYIELNYILKIQNDVKVLFENERQLLNTNRKIYDLLELKLKNINKNKRKKYVKDGVLNVFSKKCIKVYKTCKNINELRNSFSKIEALKQEFIKSIKNDDDKIEKEAKILKYLLDKDKLD